jgi:ribosomal-protein-alanine N-acetyltransferase
VETLCSPYLTFVDARTCENELVKSFRIRAANTNDLTKICEIEDAAFSRDPYPAFLIQRLINDDSALFYVSTDESGEIVGYLVSKIEDDAAHLLSLAVLPGDRRLGAATLLLRELTTALRRLSVREIRLEVKPDNEGAIELYTQLSFREESVIPGYYSDGSPALLMRKVIE